MIVLDWNIPYQCRWIWNSSDVLTKFGVRDQDEITLVVSKERYDDFITPFIKQFPEGERANAAHPNEGDLIYLPLDNALFEIKYIERKVPFYQLNELFMYEFRCEIFNLKMKSLIYLMD